MPALSSPVVTSEPKAAKSKTGRIEIVEAGRGIAALAVVCYHAANLMAPPQYSGQVGMRGLFSKGFLGVDFFFALSGFIILYVHYHDVGNPARWLRYVWRRVTRIYPAYWAAFFISLIINLLFQSNRPRMSAGWLIGNFFLYIPQEPWLGPAWTLQYELLFYLVFSLLIFQQRLGLILLATWITAVCWHAVTGRMYEGDGFFPFWKTLLFHSHILQFATGMSLAWCVRTGKYLIPLVTGYALLSVAGAGYFLSVSDNWNSPPSFALRIPLFATVLGGMLVLWKRTSFAMPKALTGLGAISYSLYLIHLLPIGLLFAVLARAGLYARLPEALVWAAGVSIAILSATIFYRLIEKPVMAWAQRMVP